MTQHIDLSLVGRVRGRGAWWKRRRKRKRVVYKRSGRKGGIKYIRQIYALLGFLDAHSFTQGLYVVLSSYGGIRKTMDR